MIRAASGIDPARGGGAGAGALRARGSGVLPCAPMARPRKAELDESTRIAVLWGKERSLQLDHTAALLDALRRAHGEVDTIRFDGETAESADILDECRSFGLMQQHKLVVVDNADKLLARDADAKRSPRRLMESYAESPSDAATLVLRAPTWRKGNLDKAVAKVGAVVACEPLTPAEAAAWAVNAAKQRHNVKLDRAAADRLVDSLGTDLSRLDSELAKLAVAADGEAVGVDLVREMVGQSREEEFWTVQRVLLDGDPRAALEHLRYCIDVCRHDPVPLSWAYVDLARKLHGMCRAVAQGDDRCEAAKTLRLWGDSLNAVAAAAQRIPPAHAAALLREAVETDSRLKSSGADPVVGLEILTLRFTSLTGR